MPLRARVSNLTSMRASMCVRVWVSRYRQARSQGWAPWSGNLTPSPEARGSQGKPRPARRPRPRGPGWTLESGSLLPQSVAEPGLGPTLLSPGPAAIQAGGLRLCLSPAGSWAPDLPPASLFYHHGLCPAWRRGALPAPSQQRPHCAEGSLCERRVQPDR